MISLVVLLAIFGGLFGLAFITKRRFGVLGLSLAAGFVLSSNWAGTLTPFLEQQGVSIVAPPLATIVAAGLIVAPPLFLLFGGPTYSSGLQRMFGSLTFALLAMTFLLTPLGAALNFDGPGLQAFEVLVKYQSLVIVAGLVGAVVDILLTRNHAKDKKHK